MKAWLRAVPLFVGATHCSCGGSETTEPISRCNVEITVGPSYLVAEDGIIESFRRQAYSDLVFAGGRLWFAFGVQNGGGDSRVFMKTIECDGSSGELIGFDDPDDFAFLPALATDGQNVAMTWTADESDFHFSSWDAESGEMIADNVPVLGEGPVDAGFFRFGFVSPHPTEGFIVSGTQEVGTEIHGLMRRVSTSGEPLGDPITASTASFMGPRVASLGESTVLAGWEDPDSGNHSMARYSAELELDSEPIANVVIDDIGWASWDTDGKEHAFYAYSGVGLSDGDARLLEATSGVDVVLSDRARYPDVAIAGDGSGGLAYVRYNPEPLEDGLQTVVRRFTFDGERFTLGEELVLSSDASAIGPRIVYVDRGVYFVVWTENGDLIGDNFLHGQFVVLDPASTGL